MNHEDESGNGGWQVSERLSAASDYRTTVAPNRVLADNQDLEVNVEPMEIERHGSRVETQSLYRRGKQSDYQFHTR